MKKLKKRWTLEDNDTCGGHRWTVVFLVVLVVGVVEEGSPSDFQQQVGGGTRLDMAAQAAAIIREKRKRLIPKYFFLHRVRE